MKLEITARGSQEGWYVELHKAQHRCITCGSLTYGRNIYGQPQDFTCYFEALVKGSAASAEGRR